MKLIIQAFLFFSLFLHASHGVSQKMQSPNIILFDIRYLLQKRVDYKS